MRPSARRAVDLGKEADHDWGVYFILFFLVLYLLFYLVVVFFYSGWVATLISMRRPDQMSP
jgi:hypothetical protein